MTICQRIQQRYWELRGTQTFNFVEEVFMATLSNYVEATEQPFSIDGANAYPYIAYFLMATFIGDDNFCFSTDLSHSVLTFA